LQGGERGGEEIKGKLIENENERDDFKEEVFGGEKKGGEADGRREIDDCIEEGGREKKKEGGWG
jgi:hypothetical protein